MKFIYCNAKRTQNKFCRFGSSENINHKNGLNFLMNSKQVSAGIELALLERSENSTLYYLAIKFLVKKIYINGGFQELLSMNSARNVMKNCPAFRVFCRNLLVFAQVWNNIFQFWRIFQNSVNFGRFLEKNPPLKSANEQSQFRMKLTQSMIQTKVNLRK